MKDMVTRLQLSDLVLQKALELARLVKVRLLVWAPGDGYGSAKENLTFHRVVFHHSCSRSPSKGLGRRALFASDMERGCPAVCRPCDLTLPLHVRNVSLLLFFSPR